MGSYDRWVGDIEDYTDEEVCDYRITAVARERIGKMREAWGWCKVRRDTAAMLPGEATVADTLLGREGKRGKLRTLAEDLYTLVSTPEDGEAVALLGPWKLEDIEIPLFKGSLVEFCELMEKEVRFELVRAATMTKAVPRYNRLVRKSYFPQAPWGYADRSTYNKVMYRLEKEVGIWNDAATSVKSR